MFPFLVSFPFFCIMGLELLSKNEALIYSINICVWHIHWKIDVAVIFLPHDVASSSVY